MIKDKKVAVIIPAAGQGKRMQTDVSKQFIKVNEKPILAYTIEKFEQSVYIDDIILVVAKETVDYVKDDIKEKYHLSKVSQIVEGGKERQDSVYNGLKALKDDIDIVLIHDGARPLIEVEDIDRIVKKTLVHKASILGVKVKDTIKRVDVDGNVRETPDRNSLFSVQTPQGFYRNLLIKAYEQGLGSEHLFTDDAMVVERYSDVSIKMVEGKYSNIKITTPEDLVMFKNTLFQANVWQP